MSNTAMVVHGSGPAARAVRQADDGIGTWLVDLVSGSGSSPSHIIITGILGVVPGVGQAMDARDLIIGIIHISKSPAGIGGWVELVITLIGCVPAIGDALKVGFKLAKQGHNFGRVLEAVSPKVRGNVERYMRTINWGHLASESKGLLHKALNAFIDGLDSWLVRALAGGGQVKMVIAELKSLQKQAPKMVDEAFIELRKIHSKMMGHELSLSTAAVGGTTSRAIRSETKVAAKTVAKKEAKTAAKTTAKAEKKLIPKKSRDTKANRAGPNSTKKNTKKAAKKKNSRNKHGVLAEHLTDYYVRNKYHYPKVNHLGRLTEHKDSTGTGLDHLWFNAAHLEQQFIVGDTKSSIFDAFRLMAALPKEYQDKFSALKAEEAENPLPNKKPSTPINANRDQHAGTSIQIGDTADHDKHIRKGVNRPNEETKLPTQMSHAWIAHVLPKEKLTPTGHKLVPLLKKHEKDFWLNPNAPYPYQRWISLVTGRQFTRHNKPNGHHHEIQIKLELPNKILDR
jgi:hypothetical protein